MAKTVWLPLTFNGTGSNSFNAAREEGSVKKVVFRNEGAAAAVIGVGSLNGVSISILPRESFPFECVPGDVDTTTYYVRFLGSGTQNVVALIQKTIE